MDNQEKGIRKIQLTSEMKTSFMNYAMSVIVARALPDVRDGMKPVLFMVGMNLVVIVIKRIRNLRVSLGKLWGNITLMEILQFMKP